MIEFNAKLLAKHVRELQGDRDQDQLAKELDLLWWWDLILSGTSNGHIPVLIIARVCAWLAEGTGQTLGEQMGRYFTYRDTQGKLLAFTCPNCGSPVSGLVSEGVIYHRRFVCRACALIYQNSGQETAEPEPEPARVCTCGHAAGSHLKYFGACGELQDTEGYSGHDMCLCDKFEAVLPTAPGETADEAREPYWLGFAKKLDHAGQQLCMADPDGEYEFLTLSEQFWQAVHALEASRAKPSPSE